MQPSPLFEEELLQPSRPLKLGDGGILEKAITLRKSRLYPGHVSLIAPLHGSRALPIAAHSAFDEPHENAACRLCHPDRLMKEAPEERRTLQVRGRSYILARTPFYYLPGHAILFPEEGPHSLAETGEEDWLLLLQAGVHVASTMGKGLRFGFNAGTYLCSGGSQRHLHLQLVPLPFSAPAEETLRKATGQGFTFDELREAYISKGLVADEGSSGRAFLAACFAPRFDFEMIAVFDKPLRYAELSSSDTACLARWIHRMAHTFVVPARGGLNGYGLETGTLPFMVRLIPRLPGAVQAFLETGAGCMVLRHAPRETARRFQESA